MLPVGTLVNVVSVLMGGSLGLFLHKKFPERFRSIIFQSMGLFSLVLGMLMAIEIKEPILLVFALVLGGLTGEAFKNRGTYKYPGR